MAAVTPSQEGLDVKVAATEASGSTFSWEGLLAEIVEGRVVPIVGQDLLTVDRGGQALPLYALLGERLADHLEVERQHSVLTLNEVAARYLERGGRSEEVYQALKHVTPADDELPVPEPLLKLARMEPLKLFVSTTFDNLLERAINEVRFDGRPKTQVISYSPRDQADLPSEWHDLQRPTVFHLMGRLSALPYEYAVSDEDTLEFVHSLHSPERLFHELNDNHVLLLGLGFPDWLMRFFIRSIRHVRFWNATGNVISIADRGVSHDASLRDFLQHSSYRTQVFEGGALEFVDELYTRWTVQREPLQQEPPERSPVRPEPGTVFISYASEDRPVALAISEVLKGQGIPVWLSHEQFAAGGNWREQIRDAISNSSVFVPIISKHVLQPGARYFREEWSAALAIAERLPRSRSFIVPVAVDDISPAAVEGRDMFKELQWTRLPDGRATPELVDLIRPHVHRSREERVFDPVGREEPRPRASDSATIPGVREATAGIGATQSNDRVDRVPIHSAPLVDENVQFTVYRPRVVKPEVWYPLLAFAHLSERREPASEDEPHPVQEVERRAERILGPLKDKFPKTVQESMHPVPQAAEITLVPEIVEIEFNPARRSFRWEETVHGEEFHLRANAKLDGHTARGRMTVFLGSIVLAEVTLNIRVDSASQLTSPGEPLAVDTARRYRNIFVSYSHQDTPIVEQIVRYAALGDRYMRDSTNLRAGQVWSTQLQKLITQADIFQLFWSWNSIHSTFVKQEWQHALSLGRPNFVRPTYWEDPLPRVPQENLPPPELEELHFQRIDLPSERWHSASPRQGLIVGVVVAVLVSVAALLWLLFKR